MKDLDITGEFFSVLNSPKIAKMFYAKFLRSQAEIEAEFCEDMRELAIFDAIRDDIRKSILRAMDRERGLRTPHKREE